MIDKNRLNKEFVEFIELARKTTALQTFVLFCKVHAHPNWSDYVWRGMAPTGQQVEISYSDDHPLDMMHVEVTPRPDTHHFYNDGICYMRPEQWNANWTASAVILTVLRFLADYAQGKLK